ncbi:hypothetical protein [Paenibacillus lautus]|uniref:hypothetical protein n=1 Tax=Paenibacillus lautus TaxID=1401 RepID=UPI001C7D4FAD|nr:hypothetical protein [Paenibacillus lautus]MBX4145946.1 hypothetical protein [Paenibacillus lautus]
MRPLTGEEKALSKAAKQRANKQLQAQRREIGVRIKEIENTPDPEYPVAHQRQTAVLAAEFESIRDVKGDPVILQMVGVSITLNYEMLRRFIRSLKNRQWNMSLDASTGSSVLIITHHINLWGKDRGYVELYDLPLYQKELLTDLPVIEIERN